MAGIAEESRHELRSATVIYGSPRQLDLLDDTVTAPKRRWPSPMLPALESLLDDQPIGDVHVVASGDPLLHGIGATLIRIHGADRIRVLPHVSSVALACAASPCSNCFCNRLLSSWTQAVTPRGSNRHSVEATVLLMNSTNGSDGRICQAKHASGPSCPVVRFKIGASVL
jgi:precorrin-6Y C5,15-methyltransferase (decarboxylating)